MIDEDAFAGENMIDGDANNPVIRRCNIGSQRRADILPLCGLRGLPFMIRTLPKMPVRLPFTGSTKLL